MNRAQNAILSGCSASGLTAILNCDKFGGLLPASAKVKCLGDAGFFVNAKDVSENQHIQAFFAIFSQYKIEGNREPEFLTMMLTKEEVDPICIRGSTITTDLPIDQSEGKWNSSSNVLDKGIAFVLSQVIL